MPWRLAALICFEPRLGLLDLLDCWDVLDASDASEHLWRWLLVLDEWRRDGACVAAVAMRGCTLQLWEVPARGGLAGVLGADSG